MPLKNVLQGQMNENSTPMFLSSEDTGCRETKPPWKIITCFERQLILLLAFVIVESADTDPSPSAGIILK